MNIGVPFLDKCLLLNWIESNRIKSNRIKLNGKSLNAKHIDIIVHSCILSVAKFDSIISHSTFQPPATTDESANKKKVEHLKFFNYQLRIIDSCIRLKSIEIDQKLQWCLSNSISGNDKIKSWTIPIESSN